MSAYASNGRRNNRCCLNTATSNLLSLPIPFERFGIIDHVPRFFHVAFASFDLTMCIYCKFCIIIIIGKCDTKLLFALWLWSHNFVASDAYFHNRLSAFSMANKRKFALSGLLPIQNAERMDHFVENVY